MRIIKSQPTTADGTRCIHTGANPKFLIPKQHTDGGGDTQLTAIHCFSGISTYVDSHSVFGRVRISRLEDGSRRGK